jgi:hypothetical protein
MAKEPTNRITCSFWTNDTREDVGCLGTFVPPKRISGDRAAMCPNCRHNIDAWSRRLAKDPDAARLYRGRLTLRSARMDNVLTSSVAKTPAGKVIHLRRRRA